MSRNKQTELETLGQEISDFLAKTLFAALLIGTASTAFLKSTYAENYPELIAYAIEGRRIGFGTASVITGLYFLWIKRKALLEGLTQVLNWLFASFFEILKYVWSSIRGARLILPANVALKTSEHSDQQILVPDGYPGYDILPAQPKIEFDTSGEKIARQLARGLKRIGLEEETIQGIEIVSIHNGPASVLIELKLPDGLTQSKIESMAKNLKSALGVPSLEIIEGSAPGQAGIIIGRENRAPVYLRSLLESREFQRARKQMRLPIPIGIDMKGNMVFEDLTRFPHALVAGATNSGKSVWLVQAITTLAMIRSPAELQLLLIDPKRVEFTIFENLPHVARIETDPEKAIELLEYLVTEMDRRFALFQERKVKNLYGYNEKAGQEERLPMLVCIVDEFNDLMMVAGKKVLEPIFVRIAQLARAAGIHLIIATQRPSVDVITGVIKGNLPTRICFSLTTQADYVTVFGTEVGAGFQLRGYGDGVARIEGRLDGLLRFQGATVSMNDIETEQAIQKLAEFWKCRSEAPNLPDMENLRLPANDKGMQASHLMEDEAIITIHEDQPADAAETNVVEETVAFRELEYQVALQIIEAIENTPEEKEVLVSANRIRAILRKNKPDIQAVFNRFVEREWLVPEPGKGYRVLQEDQFYRLCDQYEQAG